jgi:GNAT superfamily N-acetyltransferase
MNLRVALAETREEVARCFPVMRELRTMLADEVEFVERVARQQTGGFRLAYVEEADEIRAVAGFRYLESLVCGRFLYVDDLVTRAVDRSRGFGEKLLNWLTSEARAAGCAELHLDSGVQRFEAHRFYLTQRMRITAHHFTLPLS